MRILVACEFPETALEQLRALGSEVAYAPRLAGGELRAQLREAGIVVLGNTRLSSEAISQARGLQMIVHAGPGTGDVAMEDASAAGIFVTHCPTQHATAVAELTFALILALDGRLVDHVLALRDGRTKRDELPAAAGLAGQRLGIMDCGAVGRALARRARAFDMRVLAWSPQGSTDAPADPEIEYCNWPRELARASDIVAVYSPEAQTDDRELLLDAEFLLNLPEGSALVHVGSPAALDYAALERAVRQRHLRVALDILLPESATDPARLRLPLADLPSVLLTQHIGPLTQQERRAVGDEVVRVIRAFLVNGDVLNCLNLCEHSPATWQLVLRVRDQFGVMAAVLEAIRADGINAQEIGTRVFTGARAAWCTVNLDERPSTEALSAIRALPDVLHLELRAVV